jgi:hypothetical protein
MIHVSMTACRPPELSAADFDDYVRQRHLRFAKLLEGLRLLSATRVERFQGPEAGGGAVWVIDAWWDDGNALTRCLRSPGGLAVLGDRMTMMADPIPAVAEVTEQLRHGTTTRAMFDPSIGPRVLTGTMKLHVVVPEGRGGDVDAVIEAFGPGWPEGDGAGDGAGVGAFSVSRGTGASYPMNNVITGVEPPLLPRAPSRGTALELWLAPEADLDTLVAAHAPLRALLDDPRVVWWAGESREVMMSLPVASFLALDPEESVR